MSRENCESPGQNGDGESKKPGLMGRQRIVIKLKLPKNTIADENTDSGPRELTKFLKAWPSKARSWRRYQISMPHVSSSCQNNIQSRSNLEPISSLSPQVLSSELDIHPDIDSKQDSIFSVNMQPVPNSSQDSSSETKKRKFEEIETDGKNHREIGPVEISEREGGDHDGEVRQSVMNMDGSDETETIKSLSGEESSNVLDSKNQGTSSVEENDVRISTETPKRYVCTSCGKTFLSPKALGGHKSSHNKFKMEIYNAIDHESKMKSATKDRDQEKQSSTLTTKDVLGEENAASPESVGHDRTYSCKICFKTFSSGQALGGHQRCHWSGNVLDKDKQSARKILDFDLNELPKEEEEEGPSSLQS